MALKTQKPEIKTNDVSDFLKGASAEAPIREEIAQTRTMEKQKEKTFLLKLPHSVWKKAKLKAGAQEIPLHDFILQAIKDKLT